MTLHFDHKANRRVIRTFNKMADRAEDLRPIWPRVGAYLSRQVRRQFATRGKHMEAPWAPLAKSTRKQKRKQGFSRAPLVRSGKLKNEFVGRPMAYEKGYRSHAEFGSTSALSGWQQYGTKRNGRRHIPPRVMFRKTPEMSSEIKSMIQARIAGTKRARKKAT